MARIYRNAETSACSTLPFPTQFNIITGCQASAEFLFKIRNNRLHAVRRPLGGAKRDIWGNFQMRSIKASLGLGFFLMPLFRFFMQVVHTLSQDKEPLEHMAFTTIALPRSISSLVDKFEVRPQEEARASVL